MPTRQAVWPADLIERRRVVVELETRIRALTLLSAPTDGGPPTEMRVLTAALAGLPCPH